MTKKIDKTLRRHLYNEVKKINLADFISKISGNNFSKSGSSYKSICPMPSHKDSEPSFFVQKNHEGIWLYGCFGCGSGGTIIDFCKDFYSLDYPSEALLIIVEKSGLETGQDMLVNAIKQARITVDINKKLECAHFVAACNCRRLLRSKGSQKEITDWVGSSYRKMNDMLKNENIVEIEKISNDAIHKILERAKI